ncbi:EamA family transporter [Salinarimonas soli]|uniref:EamA family transporter n=1 Tax=Salinarimonas soli TaxID=1638099 RepID=A0A5B2VAG4_9HYPH|nr:EamA family transporter [Salinarimonas soli]KAA2235786.1 EamA family transporter [Salinarimonas soli]
MTSLPGPGLLLALGAAFSYGFNVVFARMAADDGITGVSLVIYRALVMLALVGVAALLWRRSLRVPREEWRAMGVLGLASLGIGTAYLSSVAFVPVSVAVVIFYTFPILIVLASPFVEGRRLGAPLLGVAALAFVGVVCVVGPGFERLDPRGVGLALVASVCTAVQFFAAARATRTGLVAKVFWINLIVIPTTLLVALAFGALNPPADLLRAPWAVTLTIAGFVIGFFLQIASLVRAAPVVIGLAFCAEPVVATLSSAAILGERLGPLQLLGGALVLAAIMANVILDNRPTARGRNPVSETP